MRKLWRRWEDNIKMDLARICFQKMATIDSKYDPTGSQCDEGYQFSLRLQKTSVLALIRDYQISNDNSGS
jgi:hypothetical protein